MLEKNFTVHFFYRNVPATSFGTFLKFFLEFSSNLLLNLIQTSYLNLGWANFKHEVSKVSFRSKCSQGSQPKNLPDLCWKSPMQRVRIAGIPNHSAWAKRDPICWGSENCWLFWICLRFQSNPVRESVGTTANCLQFPSGDGTPSHTPTLSTKNYRGCVVASGFGWLAKTIHLFNSFPCKHQFFCLEVSFS